MSSPLRTRCSFLFTTAALFGLAASFAQAQNFYFVKKGQTFTQTSNTGAVADAGAPFNFSVQAATNVTFTLPGGGTVSVPFVTDQSGQSGYQLDQSFTSQVALDAAFPAGTYRMTGTGLAPLSFNFTTDLYPVATPQVTGGTWNAGGLLVVDPTRATTITFSTFTGYATTGVGGHMEARVQGLFDNVNLGRNNGILSVANPFGITVQSAPLTSMTIPAGALTSGRVYQASVQFETATTFDITSVPSGAAIALFNKTLNFYIAAQAAGTSTPPPVIIVQPTNQTGPAGGSVTFNLGVTVGGSAPNQNLQILWSFNGQQLNIDGTKYTFGSNGGANLTVKNLTAADAGTYTATLINANSIVTTTPVTLTLGAAPTPTPPTITQQPIAKNVAIGSTVVFSVAASGTPAPNYQWRKDGVNVSNGVNGVSGGSSATLVINGANATTAGSYSVVVTNASGSVTSNAATLTVTSTNDPGRLTNLSVLTDITAGSSFTVGTVVGGSGTSGNKALVVRAVGPSLGALGVPGTIGDPQLTLFNGSSVAVAANDNWGSDATAVTALTNAMASVGAFAFTGPTSKDAMVFQPSLTPGNYSVAVSGVNGSVGTAIAEIYDATPAGTFTPSSSRLVNVSVLKTIPSGGFLTLGFTIGGSVAKTVLIRVIGPGLAAVGVTNGTLGDPQLTLFNSSSVVIASNDDWGADPQLIDAGSRVNAFAIGNAPSKDAMLMITLPAGGYTAQARGGAGTNGLAIVEVYEVP